MRQTSLVKQISENVPSVPDSLPDFPLLHSSGRWAYSQLMSWVTEKVKQEYEARAAVPPPPQPYTPPPSAWWPVWEAINATAQAAVREFNHAQGSEQFRASAWPTKSVHIEIVSLPAAHRVATLTLQVTNEHSGDLGLTFPPQGEGIGRRGSFRMRDGKIEALP